METKENTVKKPYQSPKLTVWGSIEEITQNLAVGSPDGYGGSSAG
ncbi:lasso peptide [Chloroflexota bacterium]